MSNTFNQYEPGKPNGNYFGLPYKQGEGDIEIISVPWDVTTSYKPGTAKGPQAIIDASVQVDLFDPDVENAWEIKISNTKLDLHELNSKYRVIAEEVIDYLENGGLTTDKQISGLLQKVNKASQKVNDMVYSAAKKILKNNKLAAVVGGEHSTPLGLIKAVAEKYPGTGILHIDAHADLRQGYEGFKYSHASIMYNVINEVGGISKLVQVAVRDMCDEEHMFAQNNKKISVFPDIRIKENEYNGDTWQRQCTEIVSELPANVYISFDIDALCPYLCPNTGTPVPGGLEFAQAMHLIKQVVMSGRRIVGFDLNEVSPGEPPDDWDANVGSRVLFKLCCYAHYSNNRSGY